MLRGLLRDWFTDPITVEITEADLMADLDSWFLWRPAEVPAEEAAA